MIRGQELTEAHRIEQERIRSLASDDDVILAINRFDHWVKKQNLNYTDAVSQMLHFLRNSILNNIPLRTSLTDRMKPDFEEIIEDAKKVDPRIFYAASYISERYFSNISFAATRPKFLYMGNLVRMTQFVFGDGRAAIGVVANYNTILKQAFRSKTRYASCLNNNEEVDDRERKEAFKLFDVATLENYYNISYHNDNISGRATWAEGEEIALGIYNFIRSPESRGLLCSLLPPDGPLEVDWSDHQWVFEPINQQWLNYRQPRDLVDCFDQMVGID